MDQSPIVTREDVVFGTVNGRDLRMNLAWPADLPAAPLPALVWIHGGGWCGGDHTAGEERPAAARGYFGANIEYRLSQEAPFPAQIHDCKLALRYLRAHASEYHLDPSRIGVWGMSAGGHLVALLGTSAGVAELEGDLGYPEQSSAVQAVVNYCGPTDLTRLVADQAQWEVVAQVRDQLLGGPLAEREAEARAASPLTYVSAASAPMLHIHGVHDDVVPFAQATILDEALRAAGVESTVIPVAHAPHGFPPESEPNPEELLARCLEFFDRHLKAGA